MNGGVADSFEVCNQCFTSKQHHWTTKDKSSLLDPGPWRTGPTARVLILAWWNWPPYSGERTTPLQITKARFHFPCPLLLTRCTVWCCEIGSLRSRDAPELHTSIDVREKVTAPGCRWSMKVPVAVEQSVFAQHSLLFKNIILTQILATLEILVISQSWKKALCCKFQVICLLSREVKCVVGLCNPNALFKSHNITMLQNNNKNLKKKKKVETNFLGRIQRMKHYCPAEVTFCCYSVLLASAENRKCSIESSPRFLLSVSNHSVGELSDFSEHVSSLSPGVSASKSFCIHCLLHFNSGKTFLVEATERERTIYVFFFFLLFSKTSLIQSTSPICRQANDKLLTIVKTRWSWWGLHRVECEG